MSMLSCKPRSAKWWKSCWSGTDTTFDYNRIVWWGGWAEVSLPNRCCEDSARRKLETFYDGYYLRYGDWSSGGNGASRWLGCLLREAWLQLTRSANCTVPSMTEYATPLPYLISSPERSGMSMCPSALQRGGSARRGHPSRWTARWSALGRDTSRTPYFPTPLMKTFPPTIQQS